MTSKVLNAVQVRAMVSALRAVPDAKVVSSPSTHICKFGDLEVFRALKMSSRSPMWLVRYHNELWADEVAS
jgi:hypothetical protein